ncbi:hypothetical protein [Caulobacter sp. S45]|uniref:hypothetical protein n=1 Tax=Caulobacter sp. S45 TaxID=1641861 RepID=UPI00131D1F3E|nr:hypothetical protein [Caulobacter sp. S45]
MKRLAIAIMLIGVSAGSALAYSSPFAGTWKLNVKMSKFTGDTFTYTESAKGFHYSNGSTISYDFAMDGKDYTILPGRTMAWTKVGDHAWEVVAKNEDKVLSKTHREISADGKKMISSYVEYRPDGKTVTESDVYDRVSGSHGLAGKWKDVKVQAATDVMTITTPSAGQFELSVPSYKQTISGPTDGTPVEIKGPTIPPGAMASYKALAPEKWEYSITLKGKAYVKGVMTVSAGGKMLTDTSWVPEKEAEKTVAVYDKS